MSHDVGGVGDGELAPTFNVVYKLSNRECGFIGRDCNMARKRAELSVRTWGTTTPICDVV